VTYYLKSGEAEPPAKPADGEGADEDKPHKKPAGPGRVKLEILDAAGHVIRAYPVPEVKGAEDEGDDDEESGRGRQPPLTAQAGLNRFAWDMKYEGATRIPKSALWAASLDGPTALPGHYQVRITVDGRSQTQPFDLLPDPRLNVPAADLQKQFDLGTAIHEQLESVQQAVLEIRALQGQLAEVRKKTNGKQLEGRHVLRAADALERKVTAVEDELIQRKAIANEDPLNFPIRLNNKLGSLNQVVTRGDAAPGQPEYTEFEELRQATAGYLGAWTVLKTRDLAAFNALIKQEKLPEIVLASTTQ
jgi:hypothetical protein